MDRKEPGWSSGWAESACDRPHPGSRRDPHPTPCHGPIVRTCVEKEDSTGGLRGNVGSHRPPQVHLIVHSMESTAQYWKPVWGTLERYWKRICQTREGALATSGTLHLAQALSNRGRRGRKKDFRDAERLVKRLVAHELTLSFVPDVEQRLWRTVVRTKYQLTRNRVQLQNRLEALLEEAHIKLSSLVSDLLGASARRMLEAIAGGETNRETLAALADRGLRATQEQLQDALGVCQELNPVYRRLIKMVLDEVASIDKRIEQLNQEMASLLRPHEDQVKRLAEVPGLGVDSAQQIIAEVGATAATFPSEKHLSSWVGACPGAE